MATAPSTRSGQPHGGDHRQEKEAAGSDKKGDGDEGGSKHHLDAKASRLLKAAHRASEAAKRAYAVGIETSQTRAKQVSDVVLENAQSASESSKIFLSKVASKAGRFVDKAQTKANVSRGIKSPKDAEGESVGFPLSIMVWCGTLCGRSKKGSKVPHERELAPESGEEFSTEFLASAADEYATTLEEDAKNLEDVVAAVPE